MQCALEERLARPGRLLSENVVSVIEHYGSDVPYRSRFHQVDELGIDRFIANPVSDDIDSRAHDRFSIIKIVDVGGYPQAVLMCLVDHRGMDFRPELGHQPARAIEPNLDHIGFAGRHLTDRSTRYLDGVRSRGLVLANWRLATERLATDHPDQIGRAHV